jgi:hypothetical protein
MRSGIECGTAKKRNSAQAEKNSDGLGYWPRLAQSLYALRRAGRLDRPCPILIRLAGFGGRTREHGLGAHWETGFNLAWRGGPISAGWNRAAEASVQSSDSAKSLPMLEVPVCAESQRLPNAVAVSVR